MFDIYDCILNMTKRILWKYSVLTHLMSQATFPRFIPTWFRSSSNLRISSSNKSWEDENSFNSTSIVLSSSLEATVVMVWEEGTADVTPLVSFVCNDFRRAMTPPKDVLKFSRPNNARSATRPSLVDEDIKKEKKGGSVSGVAGFSSLYGDWILIVIVLRWSSATTASSDEPDYLLCCRRSQSVDDGNTTSSSLSLPTSL